MDPQTAAMASPTPESAIPPQTARVVAFVSVLLGGLCGGLIGIGVGRFECEGSCGFWHGATMMAGAIIGAVGVAVVVVLALRAMGEWHTIREVGQPRRKSG